MPRFDTVVGRDLRPAGSNVWAAQNYSEEESLDSDTRNRHLYRDYINKIGLILQILTIRGIGFGEI